MLLPFGHAKQFMQLAFDEDDDDERQKDDESSSCRHAARSTLEVCLEGILTFTDATHQSLMSSAKNNKSFMPTPNVINAQRRKNNMLRVDGCTESTALSST